MSENPSLNGNPSGLETPSAVGQIGRPPDAVIQLSCPPPLERCREPGVIECEPVDKRACNREVVLDANMMEVEEGQKEEVSAEGGTVPTSGEAIGRENDRGPVDNLAGKESYASMVARNSDSGADQDGVCDAGSVEIKVSESDYVIDRSGPFPTVQFSDKVHDQIDRNMRNSVIIRLLGRKIGFKALLSRILALWKPFGELQLIDLENDYFLVKFSNEMDFAKVLTGGPWTVYGSYLTVQPWNRTFVTSEKYPSHVVVWVRLPGLPYRYYSKALFRIIASVVGRVVKVDYNTQEAERGKFARLAVMVDLNKPLLSCIGIDGRVQKLEYEGLHQICFGCGVYGHSKDDCERVTKNVALIVDSVVEGKPVHHDEPIGPSKDDLYGPWMVVDTRRRRASGVSGPVKNASGNKDRASTSHGSRFTALVVEDVMTPTDESVEPNNVVGVLNTVSTTPKLTAGQVSKSIVQRPMVVKNAAYKASNPDKRGSKQPELNVGLPVKPICVDQEVEVVHHPVAHHSDNHNVVSLVDKYPGSLEVIGGKMQRVRGAAGRALNSSARRGFNIKKPAGVRPLSQSPLSEWAVNFSKQLAVSGDTVGGHVLIQPMSGLSEAPGDGLRQSTV
ncbi:hypothetical protein GQ457_16G011210 [Hibiscus cannabinus]